MEREILGALVADHRDQLSIAIADIFDRVQRSDGDVKHLARRDRERREDVRQPDWSEQR